MRQSNLIFSVRDIPLVGSPYGMWCVERIHMRGVAMYFTGLNVIYFVPQNGLPGAVHIHRHV